jgi:hypothetical protein
MGLIVDNHRTALANDHLTPGASLARFGSVCAPAEARGQLDTDGRNGHVGAGDSEHPHSAEEFQGIDGVGLTIPVTEPVLVIRSDDPNLEVERDMRRGSRPRYDGEHARRRNSDKQELSYQRAHTSPSFSHAAQEEGRTATSTETRRPTLQANMERQR